LVRPIANLSTRNVPETAPAQTLGVGGPRSFEEIYAEYFPFVWRCLRGLGVRREALEDVAQEVFLAVHRRLPTFEGSSTLRTWLYGIVRNVASNHRRHWFRKGERQQELEQEPASAGPGPFEQAQERQAAEFVQSFLAGLPPPKRELFMLAILEEMSVPEVATALAIPLNTAYSRLRSLRAEMERALSKRGGSNVP
jgi:RNA polymerase sigma-70 factor (ECF subfamily)